MKHDQDKDGVPAPPEEAPGTESQKTAMSRRGCAMRMSLGALVPAALASGVHNLVVQPQDWDEP